MNNPYIYFCMTAWSIFEDTWAVAPYLSLTYYGCCKKGDLYAALEFCPQKAHYTTACYHYNVSPCQMCMWMRWELSKDQCLNTIKGVCNSVIKLFHVLSIGSTQKQTSTLQVWSSAMAMVLLWQEHICIWKVHGNFLHLHINKKGIIQTANHYWGFGLLV